MYSRVAVLPLGRRTTSRRTSRSLPSNTCAEETVCSIRWSSSRLPVFIARSAFLIAEPVARNQKIAVEPRFGRAGRGLPVVAPFHDRRQGHEYRLRAAIRLQP